MRVKEVFEFWMLALVAPRVGRKNKGFEEPRRVRQVPFDRAGLRHRLHQLVFRRERSSKCLSLAANCSEALEELLCLRGLLIDACNGRQICLFSPTCGGCRVEPSQGLGRTPSARP